MVRWLALLLLGGCTASTPLVLTSTCPPRPVLPAVKAAELQTLTDETYRKLIMREQALKTYARILEANCVGDNE